MSQAGGLSEVKNVIAVASGKGGVGKSTVTANLALGLTKKGFKVGVIDADIYGPSQVFMMGKKELPKNENGLIHPIEQYGIKYISMGVLNQKDEATVIRSPLAIKAIQQFLVGVIWGELDYLLIDLPPGTGDIQLTLAQQAQLTGAIIVTTPQKVARGIAKKGLQMFEMVNVPILGIVENMSGYTCNHCGEVTKIFKTGGGEDLAKELSVPFLGGIPLDPEVMVSGDDGVPVLEKETESPVAKAFISLTEEAHKNAVELKDKTRHVEPENILIHPETGQLKVVWKDGTDYIYNPIELRSACPCAKCVDENTGEKILRDEDIPLDIKVNSARSVGRYGLSIGFSDGHNTGIYRFSKLRELENTEEASGFEV